MTLQLRKIKIFFFNLNQTYFFIHCRQQGFSFSFNPRQFQCTISLWKIGEPVFCPPILERNRPWLAKLESTVCYSRLTWNQTALLIFRDKLRGMDRASLAIRGRVRNGGCRRVPRGRTGLGDWFASVRGSPARHGSHLSSPSPIVARRVRDDQLRRDRSSRRDRYANPVREQPFAYQLQRALLPPLSYPDTLIRKMARTKVSMNVTMEDSAYGT